VMRGEAHDLERENGKYARHQVENDSADQREYDRERKRKSFARRGQREVRSSRGGKGGFRPRANLATHGNVDRRSADSGGELARCRQYACQPAEITGQVDRNGKREYIRV